jgi:hypothetical protein
MKVKELMALLSKRDPEAEVIVPYGDGEYHARVVSAYSAQWERGEPGLYGPVGGVFEQHQPPEGASAYLIPVVVLGNDG